jgi:hypothetical protein
MSFLTRPLAWPSWKFGVLKISMISFGVLIGTYFHDFWLPWQGALWALFAVTAVVTAVWGIQALFGPESVAVTRK